MPVRASCSTAESMCPPRRIYVDAGVNWGNTARLFESFDDSSGIKAPWEVFGFEASPLIQPWADAFFSWLDGSAEPPPETCLPKSGSTSILNLYATAHGCPRYPRLSTHLVERMLKCMETRLAPHLQALQPAPHLNSSSLVRTRLAAACPVERCEGIKARHQARNGKVGGEGRGANSASRHAAYTFIPAAAASSIDAEYLELYTPPFSMLRGGSVPADNVQQAHLQQLKRNYTYRVLTANLPEWLATSFTEADHVVLKVGATGSRCSCCHCCHPALSFP